MGTGSRSKFEPVDFGKPKSKGKAKLIEASSGSSTKPILPDRENTIALGAELVSLRRGGVTTKVPADEAIMDALVQRALKGRLADCVDLYKRLDREENEAITTPVKTFSPYMRRKGKESVLSLMRGLSAYAAKLVDEGLIEFVGGKYVVSSEARTILQNWNAAEA